MLDNLLERATRVSQVLVWLGGCMLIFAACMTTADVVLRKLISFSFAGADEIAGYLFASATAFASSSRRRGRRISRSHPPSIPRASA